MKSSTAVVVTGLGLSTALGFNALTTWQKIKAGESAIALHQPFLDLAPLPLAMGNKSPLGLAAIIEQVTQAAWEDAGLALSRSELADDCGVVVGSSRSYLRDWEAMVSQQRRACASVTSDWLKALPHGPAVSVAKIVGSAGPVLAPMAACATGIWAIAQAADLIRSGRCQRVIAGAVESPITPLTLAGFGKMGALAKTGCYPFDQRREGFVLGEGGALLVLESAAVAAARGARVYGQILAAGLSNDAHHVSSFAPSYRMGGRSLKSCLQRNELAPQDIDAVHVHGTSTAQNDRMEANLIAPALGRQVPVMATKGATGHMLGASGAVTVALSLISLQQQALLPCVGLKTADFDLNFVRLGFNQALTKPLQNILCFSFGFGGQNAVIALSRY